MTNSSSLPNTASGQSTKEIVTRLMKDKIREIVSRPNTDIVSVFISTGHTDKSPVGLTFALSSVADQCHLNFVQTISLPKYHGIPIYTFDQVIDLVSATLTEMSPTNPLWCQTDIMQIAFLGKPPHASWITTRPLIIEHPIPSSHTS